MRDLFPLGKVWMTEIAVPALYAAEHLTLTVHGKIVDRDGPLVVVCAGMHGDEISGLEIIRRLIADVLNHVVAGGVIVVPMLNVYGFVQQSRYLPDRRDLNRMFPGRKSGSLSSRYAYLLCEEIFSHATVILDLHSAAVGRTNFPHIRYTVGDTQAAALATTFGAPVTLCVAGVQGSLRMWGTKNSVPTLVYESGEALHVSPFGVKVGLSGVMAVLRAKGMLSANAPVFSVSNRLLDVTPLTFSATKWVRAHDGGLLISDVSLGQKIEKGEKLGRIESPFRTKKVVVKSPVSGVVVSTLTNPWVNEGDGLFHIAYDAESKRDRGLDPIEIGVSGYVL